MPSISEIFPPPPPPKQSFVLCQLKYFDDQSSFVLCQQETLISACFVFCLTSVLYKVKEFLYNDIYTCMSVGDLLQLVGD